MKHGIASIIATPPMCLLAGSAYTVHSQNAPIRPIGRTRLQPNTTMKREGGPAGAVFADNNPLCLSGTRTTVSTFQ